MNANKIKALEKKSKVGWAKYYGSETIRHNLVRDYIIRMRQLEEEIKKRDAPLYEKAHIPEFVKTEMINMIKELKKEIECPICLIEIKTDEIKFSSCGHKYCNSCLSKIDKCAICRKKIYPKKI